MIFYLDRIKNASVAFFCIPGIYCRHQNIVILKGGIMKEVFIVGAERSPMAFVPYPESGQRSKSGQSEWSDTGSPKFRSDFEVINSNLKKSFP